MCLPPHHAEAVGKLVFRIVGTDGRPLGDFEGSVEKFGGDGTFARARATWPTDLAVPGEHFLLGIAYDRNGQELARVAPRMVSVHNTQGY